MKRRALLMNLTAGLIFIGIAVLIRSLSPNDVAAHNQRIRVKLDDVPQQGALEVEYLNYRAFIVRSSQVDVFLIPFYDGAYRLPEGTWQRAYLPCVQFTFANNLFSCVDKALSHQGLEHARWDATGTALAEFMPNLQRARYKLDGSALVLSPEFNE